MKRIAVIGSVALVLGACGTSGELQTLGDKLGCEEVRETGKIDMQGTGVVGFCDGALPEGKTGLLLTFRSEDARDEFFSDVWYDTEFAGSYVIVGDDWAVAADADSVDAAAMLHDAITSRVGGVPLEGSD